MTYTAPTTAANNTAASTVADLAAVLAHHAHVAFAADTVRMGPGAIRVNVETDGPQTRFWGGRLMVEVSRRRRNTARVFTADASPIGGDRDIQAALAYFLANDRRA